MKRNIYKTNRYLGSLTIGLFIWVHFVYVYLSGYINGSITKNQELALSVIILGIILEETVSTYRYVRQYSFAHLEKRHPYLYCVFSNLSIVTAISICYVEASLLTEGLFYKLFIVLGTLFVFLLIANLTLFIIKFTLKHLIQGE